MRGNDSSSRKSSGGELALGIRLKSVLLPGAVPVLERAAGGHLGQH